MSYEPTTWKSGDTVTSAKLNKMEQGIASGGGVLVATVDSEGALDKTWQEIHDADYAVMKSIESSAIAVAPLVNVYSLGGEKYAANFYNGEGILSFETTSADGYPTYTDSNG